MSKKTLFLQGNETCVEAALYAGLGFFAGYPITPSSEIMELLSMRLPQEGGKFIQMEDEIASMCAIVGASLTGLKSMTATSGPGFSLKQEAIGYAIMAEVPCVIVNVQRGGPSTGLPTGVSQGDVMQTRWGTHGDHAIVTLTASNHQDLFAMTVEAFNTFCSSMKSLAICVRNWFFRKLVRFPWLKGFGLPLKRAQTTIPIFRERMEDCPCRILAASIATM
jgi:2-oxoglutarate ferredoxin oxidoreductase subunit alpha